LLVCGPGQAPDQALLRVLAVPGWDPVKPWRLGPFTLDLAAPALPELSGALRAASGAWLATLAPDSAPGIPSNKSRKPPVSCDKALNRQRHRIENISGRLQDFVASQPATTDARPPSAAPSLLPPSSAYRSGCARVDRRLCSERHSKCSKMSSWAWKLRFDSQLTQMGCDEPVPRPRPVRCCRAASLIPLIDTKYC